jgi:hypothetical protein
VEALAPLGPPVSDKGFVRFRGQEDVKKRIAVGTHIALRPPGRRRQSPTPAPTEPNVRISRTGLVGR